VLLPRRSVEAGAGRRGHLRFNVNIQEVPARNIKLIIFIYYYFRHYQSLIQNPINVSSGPNIVKGTAALNFRPLIFSSTDPT
jgi:hypothetical protein